MAGFEDAMRRGVQRMIEAAPTVIGPWQRITKVPDAEGGLKDQVTTVGPYTVRLYRGRIQGTTPETGLLGYREIANLWRMLAPETADLPFSAGVNDEIDVPGYGHFRVHTVYPIVAHAIIVGWQADLERLGPEQGLP